MLPFWHPPDAHTRQATARSGAPGEYCSEGAHGTDRGSMIGCGAGAVRHWHRPSADCAERLSTAPRRAPPDSAAARAQERCGWEGLARASRGKGGGSGRVTRTGGCAAAAGHTERRGGGCCDGSQSAAPRPATRSAPLRPCLHTYARQAHAASEPGAAGAATRSSCSRPLSSAAPDCSGPLGAHGASGGPVCAAPRPPFRPARPGSHAQCERGVGGAPGATRRAAARADGRERRAV